MTNLEALTYGLNALKQPVKVEDIENLSELDRTFVNTIIYWVLYDEEGLITLEQVKEISL